MNNEFACCSDTDHISGCMVCGRELYCIPDKLLRATCFYCGRVETTSVFCLAGHYVCNECHRKDILDIVESVCNESDLGDPLALALKIFALPELHMHGPEYHSIVPAVLVAAYCNCAGEEKGPAIREAISRGKEIFGGICGTHGACGACIGIGIAYSIIHRVTPYSEKSRGRANYMTALALMAISRFGGPRCCKRDSILAIEAAREHFGGFAHAAASAAKYICRQFANNDKCIGKRCPYHPQI